MKTKFFTAFISASLMMHGALVPVFAAEKPTAGAEFIETSADGTDLTEEAAAVSSDLEAARIRYEQAKAQYDLGSVGFFKEQADLGSSDARQAYEILINREVRKYAEYVKIGDTNSPTHLENMKKAVDEMNMVNEYRENENKTEGSSLNALKTNHTMNAISQYHTSYSSSVMGHARVFGVSENLAWGYRNPFDGWYDSEKELYKAGEQTFSKIGHYLNVVNSSYTVMGYSYNTGRVYGQTFTASSTYGSDPMSVEEYQALFNDYYSRVTTELEQSQAAYESLQKTELTDLNIDISGLQSSYVWSGQQITPAVTVSINGTILNAGTDYTVSYQSNINPGTASITITGQGKYTGTKTVTFKIEKRNLCEATVSGIEKNYLYTGLSIAPKPSVTWHGTVLREGTDYSLSYTNNISTGTATLTITGIGSYTGERGAAFQIQKRSIAQASVSGIEKEYLYSGNIIAPLPAVSWNGKTLQKGVDYSLFYDNNTNAGTASVIIVGLGSYNESKIVTFQIQKRNIAQAGVSGIEKEYKFTGNAIAPKPLVTWNGAVLQEGTDYSLSYAGSVNPGTASITITGKGNYSGSKTVTFVIQKPQTVPGTSVPEVKKIVMHRLYNPNSGEHFYTSDTKEKDFLASIGWRYEGEGWKAPESSSTPVYRLYNENAGDHHYTQDSRERSVLIGLGWKDEGIGWYSDDAKGVPLYRQYNPNAVAGSHNYTTDKNEHDFLINQAGWKDEKIGWYGMK